MVLGELAADGTAIVLATHDVELAAEVATRTVVLADGEVVADGPTDEVVVGSPAFAPQVAKVLAPAAWLTADRGRRRAGGAAVSAADRAATARRRRRSGCARGPRWRCCWRPRSASPPSPGRCSSTRARGSPTCARPPLLFTLLLPLVLMVVLSELADGGIDAKAVAMLGVLTAVGAALRPLGTGVAGFEPVFFLLVLAGRAFGPGFGFVLGATTLFASALTTGGVGPWLPFQMLAAAWVGVGPGLLPAAARPRRAGPARRLRPGRRPALRAAAQPVVLAVHPAGADRDLVRAPATRCSTTCVGSWRSACSPRWASTSPVPW